MFLQFSSCSTERYNTDRICFLLFFLLSHFYYYGLSLFIWPGQTRTSFAESKSSPWFDLKLSLKSLNYHNRQESRVQTLNLTPMQCQRACTCRLPDRLHGHQFVVSIAVTDNFTIKSRYMWQLEDPSPQTGEVRDRNGWHMNYYPAFVFRCMCPLQMWFGTQHCNTCLGRGSRVPEHQLSWPWPRECYGEHVLILRSVPVKEITQTKEKLLSSMANPSWCSWQEIFAPFFSLSLFMGV